MISFEEARAIVSDKLLPNWHPIQGTFHVATFGSENDQFFLMFPGAREYLVDGDKNFRVIDDVIYLVEKSTGRYIEAIAYENLDLLSSFTPIGVYPADLEEFLDDFERQFRPSIEEFEEILGAFLEGSIRTCTGLNDRTSRALERIAEAHPNVPQELIDNARSEFRASK